MTVGIKPGTFGNAAWLDPRVMFGKGVVVGHCSCIGAPEEGWDRCTIGDNVRIGAFCTISMGAKLADRVEMDHYCRVGASEVGYGTRLLYGARVHDEAKIGSRCTIGGNVPDHTLVGDSVMHFGRLAHIPRRGKGWDDASDPAPVIGDNVLIGPNALIVGGVRIGAGARIKAGASVVGDCVTIGEGAEVEPTCLVRRDVPAGATVRSDMT